MKYYRRHAKVLSLGAGVQSSALLLMYLNDHLPPVDFAVFADTQSEPESVYAWLEKLKDRAQGKIPIYTASVGDLAKDALDSKFNPLPVYVNGGGSKPAIGRRQCTSLYKIRVVHQEIRRVLGYEPGGHMKHAIYMHLGISYDEIERVKNPVQNWQFNIYPLVDMQWTRERCRLYVQSHMGMEPPRSSCWMCPYRSNADWRELRSRDPGDWERAVEFDKKCNEKGSFIHYSGVPLSEANIHSDDKGRGLLNECEGMCGN